LCQRKGRFFHPRNVDEGDQTLPASTAAALGVLLRKTCRGTVSGKTRHGKQSCRVRLFVHRWDNSIPQEGTRIMYLLVSASNFALPSRPGARVPRYDEELVALAASGFISNATAQALRDLRIVQKSIDCRTRRAMRVSGAISRACEARRDRIFATRFKMEEFAIANCLQWLILAEILV
jgi:hypothetical protein